MASKLSSDRRARYGTARFTSGTLTTNYRFTGQRSEEAGLGSLYDYGARFYSVVGPIPAGGYHRAIAGGSAVFLNRYSYVNNRPLNRVDPTGHFGEGIAIRFLGQSLVGTLAIAAEAVDPLPADLVVIPFGLSLIASDPLWQLLPQSHGVTPQSYQNTSARYA